MLIVDVLRIGRNQAIEVRDFNNCLAKFVSGNDRRDPAKTLHSIWIKAASLNTRLPKNHQSENLLKVGEKVNSEYEKSPQGDDKNPWLVNGDEIIKAAYDVADRARRTRFRTTISPSR